jgi:uncharacterized protein YcaQ
LSEVRKRWWGEIRITKEQARRYVVGRELLARDGALAADGARGAAAAVRRLEYVQVDPVCVVERNHHLVLAARVPGFQPVDLDAALYGGDSGDGGARPELVEVLAGGVHIIVPVDDYPLYSGFAAYEKAGHAKELASLEPLIREILSRIEAEGPRSSLDFAHADRVPGWWHDSARAISRALALLWHCGDLVVAGRRHNRQYFDLPRRVLPARVLETARTPAARADLLLKYLRSRGLGRPGDHQYGWANRPVAERRKASESLVDGGEAVRVLVEGVADPYYAPASEADAVAGSPPALQGQVRFLPPLDNLLAGRRRLADLFDFGYVWEIYHRAEKRTYGPYAMPVLFGDRLVGRFSPALDRARRTLVVQGIWLEGTFDAGERGFADAFFAELAAFAHFHRAETIRLEGPCPEALQGHRCQLRVFP